MVIIISVAFGDCKTYNHPTVLWICPQTVSIPHKSDPNQTGVVSQETKTIYDKDANRPSMKASVRPEGAAEMQRARRNVEVEPCSPADFTEGSKSEERMLSVLLAKHHFPLRTHGAGM